MWLTLGVFLETKKLFFASVFSVAKITFCCNRCLRVSPDLCARLVTLRNNILFLTACMRFLLPACRICWWNSHNPEHYSGNACSLSTSAQVLSLLELRSVLMLGNLLTAFHHLGTISGYELWCKAGLCISILYFAQLHQESWLRSWQIAHTCKALDVLTLAQGVWVSRTLGTLLCLKKAPSTTVVGWKI